jgi:hypothetical protein
MYVHDVNLLDQIISTVKKTMKNPSSSSLAKQPLFHQNLPLELLLDLSELDHPVLTPLGFAKVISFTEQGHWPCITEIIFDANKELALK